MNLRASADKELEVRGYQHDDLRTDHFFVDSSKESSPFPALREVVFPVLFPLDLIGGTKLPRMPRRGTPYDLPPYSLLVELLSHCGETDALGEPIAPRFCFTSISCSNKTISSTLLHKKIFHMKNTKNSSY